jgi:hypothetical protein
MTQDLPQASNSGSSFKVPGPACMHYPQIGIGRADHTKRHPEQSPLPPTVAPAVLHERQFVRDAHDCISEICRCVLRPHSSQIAAL